VFAAERQDQTLADGWKFIHDDAGLAARIDQWQSVTIPHTWNTKSAVRGEHGDDPRFKSGYYRGACWYARPFDIPAAWKGKRLFIRFEGGPLSIGKLPPHLRLLASNYPCNISIIGDDGLWGIITDSIGSRDIANYPPC
jgi:hypothetical protein